MDQNTCKIKNQNNTTAKIKNLPSIIIKVKDQLNKYKAENINIYHAEKCDYTNVIIIAEGNSSVHLNALREKNFFFS